MEVKISFSLNGKKTTILTDPNQTLLWVLRNQLGLTGTKYGCGNGFCGACTVMINREAIRSCITPSRMLQVKKDNN
jgi:aerobic-type carbon monoxide dehydrogenase small subunit (CoxS/CutS family)